MKKLNYCWSFVMILALLFTSCSKDEASDVSGPDVQDTFQLQFGALLNDFEKQQTKDHNTAPVVCRDAVPTFAKIGLIDNSTGFFVGGPGNDTPFLIDVNIQDNNGSWETSYSEVLGLPAGSYSLEYFIVYSGVGDDAEVLWVAPRLGSAFAGDVGAPLPQPINLVAGTKPYIDVDVLCYESRVEEAFGYLFFDIDLTTVKNSYCIFVNYCYTDGVDADGREYPAKFMVDVWGDGFDGDDLIIDGEMNSIIAGDNPAATVLCLALPKILVGDTFFVRVTVMDDGLLPYTSNASDIFEFEISQADIDAQLGLTPKYRHLRINCGDNNQDCPLTPQQDPDGDCKPDNDCAGAECDNCPGIPNADQKDEDGDGKGDVCDNCPDDANPDQANNDGDSLGDECDNCPLITNENQANNDGDTFGDLCDNCPNDTNQDQADSDKDNNGQPKPDGVGDACDNCPDIYNPDQSTSGDTDEVPDACDECPETNGPASNNGCPEEDKEEGCGTAFMFGTTEINTISNSNRWGWAENFNTDNNDVDNSQTFDFWRGAGKNDLSKGTHAGTVTITTDGNKVEFEIDLNPGFSIDDLHVYLSEDSPGNISKSPGQYNRNGEVADDATSFTLMRTSSDNLFWVIVHAGETCNGNNGRE